MWLGSIIVTHKKAMSQRIFKLHPNVLFTGIVSFLTDVSSEMIFTLLPLFLSNILGVSTAIIGIIDGIAESTASIMKVFSGWLSDKLGKRKLLAFTGYAISAVSKPLLYFASTWGMVLGVRFADRFGKGLRTAPRDALIAESLVNNERGRGFGFHRAMDTSGAALGLVFALIVVYMLQANSLLLNRDTFKFLVVVGIIPALLSLIFFIFIKDITRFSSKENCDVYKPSSDASKVLNWRFRTFLLIIFLFTLGNSSDAFIILRAQNIGNSVFEILLMLIVFNVFYAVISIPAGMLSDRIGRRYLLIFGWTIYAITYFLLALVNLKWQIWICFILYGLYYGLAEGVARAYVADLVPQEICGTAYGIFHALVGITLLPASIIAGYLWDKISPSAPFYFGGILALVATLALLIFNVIIKRFNR